MKIFIFLGLTMILFLSSCMKLGGDLESYYPAYEDFKQHWKDLAQYLPENSTQIRHYSVLDMDTNYHFIEATVQIEGLKNFIITRNYFDSQRYNYEFSYSDQKFDSLFYKRPDWWNQDTMSTFEENYLIVFADDDNYGKGGWLFYDNDTKKIRVFTWFQQWLSQDEVHKKLNL